MALALFLTGAGSVPTVRAVIARLTGLLAEKNMDCVLVDVGGVGYHVAVSLQTLSALPALGQKVALFTHLHVREDALLLFGFATREERTAFELCIAVSGIGPKLALSILSGLDADGLFMAVATDDVGRLRKIPGIGPKTAERLVMELRDKVPSVPVTAGGKTRATPKATGVVADVMGALTQLGYRPADAEKAAARAVDEAKEAPIEQLVRNALRLLQRD